jgi:excisionase family DNA binding protein
MSTRSLRSPNQDSCMVQVREASRLLGITELAVRAAIRRGDIPARRLGRQFLIPRRALEAILSPAAPHRSEG